MSLRNTLGPTWQRLQPRERQSVVLAALVVGVALLWWVALSPALATLRLSGAQHTQLDAQLAAMQTLAAQAKQLQALPPISRDDSLRALESATTLHLGTQASLSALGDRATVTLKGAEPLALALWLADVRSNARLTPDEAKLTRTPQPGSTATSATATPPVPDTSEPPTWQGSVTFQFGR
jgi:general secretion pathway protein M